MLVRPTHRHGVGRERPGGHRSLSERAIQTHSARCLRLIRTASTPSRLRYSGNPAAAMDIAQDTFLKLLSRIGDYRSEASFDSWLYRLVVNSCIDDQRRGRRMTPFLDGLLDAVCAPAESVLHKLMRAGNRAARAGRGGKACARASHRDRAALHRGPVVRRDREDSRVFAGHRGVATESRAQDSGAAVVAFAATEGGGDEYNWLEPELQRGLREVTAPPELWDRVQGAKAFAVRAESNRMLGLGDGCSCRCDRPLVWSAVHRDSVAGTAAHSAFVVKIPRNCAPGSAPKTGLDLPLRADSSPSIRLIGARNAGGRVEIAYRAGNRDASAAGVESGRRVSKRRRTIA